LETVKNDVLTKHLKYAIEEVKWTKIRIFAMGCVACLQFDLHWLVRK
jgi:hypothetical protein